jgi:hypothetical protein
VRPEAPAKAAILSTVRSPSGCESFATRSALFWSPPPCDIRSCAATFSSGTNACQIDYIRHAAQWCKDKGPGLMLMWQAN